MTSEPCVSTTFPSNVAVLRESSATMLSASMLTGLSRSACSARSDAPPRQAETTRNTAGRRYLLPLGCIEYAPDLGLQLEDLSVLVHHQSNPGKHRAPLGDGHSMVRLQDSLLRQHVQELGVRL